MSVAGAEDGEEQHRPEVREEQAWGGGCGGIGADPPSTEVGEGGSGMDLAGKHGAGAEVAPRVRVMRGSREAEAEELE